MNNVFAAARACLDCAGPHEKIVFTQVAHAALCEGTLSLRDDGVLPLPIGAPGRPVKPTLVPARAVPRRGIGGVEGRAALVHVVAHIEFNAINLSSDAVYRFRGMPDDYYRDWIGVAVDEARHFTLLSARLAELGHVYGDFDAHNGLWEMAVKTSDSCLARMALVPRVLEARGLDVTTGMIARLRSVGDDATAGILEVILREEVAHVAAGSRWFRYCCDRERLKPRATFRRLLAEHAGALRGPFNLDARRAAGFDEDELAQLQAGV
ncbi:MAG: ferritin-like domain-containing protein [Rhodanobacteraceae bacterium]